MSKPSSGPWSQPDSGFLFIPTRVYPNPFKAVFILLFFLATLGDSAESEFVKE